MTDERKITMSSQRKQDLIERINEELCEPGQDMTLPLTDKIFAWVFPRFSYKEMCEIFDVSQDTILRRMRDLVERGIIQEKIKGRAKNHASPNATFANPTLLEELIKLIVDEELQKYGVIKE